ncbi:unannotated protein [freshwater metagenome]|uniref:Unannotated protein n=1 Tax=freshwater metagenome TaxID=449393 RepID=A0A6J7NLT9_9ZZZZ
MMGWVITTERPAAGVVRIARPTAIVSLASSLSSTLLNPARFRSARAVSRSLPSTGGTFSLPSPPLTRRFTLSPLASRVPPSGSCANTWPLGRVLDDCSEVTLKPRLSSFDLAAFSSKLVTSGTSMRPPELCDPTREISNPPRTRINTAMIAEIEIMVPRLRPRGACRGRATAAPAPAAPRPAAATAGVRVVGTFTPVAVSTPPITSSPRLNLRRSARMSSAVAYRSSGFFSSAVRMIFSSPAAIAGFRVEGGGTTS